MTDQQNYSKIPQKNLAAQPTGSSKLSEYFKSQQSSLQRRTCPPNIKKAPSGGPGIFILKALIGFGAVYLTACLGVWGEPAESSKIYYKAKQAIREFTNQRILTEDFKNDLSQKMNKSKEYVKGHIESLNEEGKVTYEKSEKYVKDLKEEKKSS